MSELVLHKGSCHCGAVRFEVWAPAKLHVHVCNCSICVKKKNEHFIVSASKFKLIQPSITVFANSVDPDEPARNEPSRNEPAYQDLLFLQGWDNITTYTFNTHTAKHTFCKTCGVQSFYTPRSNPDGFGVMPHCLDPGTVVDIEYETFDGQDWETHIKKTDIQTRSKE